MYEYCQYKNCGDRRVHWMMPDTPRGTVKTDGYAFCSMTCALMSGFLSMKDGWMCGNGCKNPVEKYGDRCVEHVTL